MESQFQLEDALAQKDFWHALHQMQESGVFGMLGRVHNNFGFARAYPLATLPVDLDLLQREVDPDPSGPHHRNGGTRT